MLRLLTLSVAIVAAAATSYACSEGLTSPPGTATEARQSVQSPLVAPQQSGTTQRFFAISPVNHRVVWASAAGGTYAVTTDGGETWRSAVVPGAADLQFRDVHAVSRREAYLLSAGEGANNRIYHTTDGGATWDLQFQAGADPRFFYDCFDFWSRNKGIAFADGIDGRFPVIRTRNGTTWQDIGDNLPDARPGEAGFAASGTCITTNGGNRAWIGTGGAGARILATTDGGNSWTAHEVPGITQGTPTSGVVSVDFRDRFHGILGGGDVVASTESQQNIALSRDGGATWELGTPTPFPGAVYGLTYVPGHQRLTVVATGPGGSAWSSNEGASWTLLPGITNCWTVAFATWNAGWLGCGGGQIYKIDFSR